MFEGNTKKQTAIVIIIFACIWLPITNYFSGQISLEDMGTLERVIFLFIFSMVGFGILDVIDDVVRHMAGNKKYKKNIFDIIIWREHRD